MRKRDKAYQIKNGPSYLIIDDFIESIVEKDDETKGGGDALLKESQKEAEAMVQTACGEGKKNRCDVIVGLMELMETDGTHGD